MSSGDLIAMAVRNLLKRKLRTFLTILGVVIGSASIVVMVSLGVGMNAGFDEIIRQMGNITVVNVQSEAYWYDAPPKGIPIIDDNAIVDFTRIEGVEAATPVIQGIFAIVSGKYRAMNSSVLGIDMSLYETLGYKLETGRVPTAEDKNGVVMGGNVGDNFYNPNIRNWWMNPAGQIQLDPLEDEFQLLVTGMQNERGKYIAKPQPLTVTGTTSRDNSNSYETYMDINTVKALNAEARKLETKYLKSIGQKPPVDNSAKKGYSQALVKCKTMDDVAAVQEYIRELGYSAWSQGEWISSMKKTSQSLQGLLGAIGAVSLFVAAIGIANTMLMSIYERTREIGVMKVIGATVSDIQKLFLFEAALIGFFGGLFGIAISYLLSYVLNNFEILSFLDQTSGWYGNESQTQMSVIPLWLCGVGLVFSTVVGIVSGFFPARRATKLSALAAIRTE